MLNVVHDYMVTPHPPKIFQVMDEEEFSVVCQVNTAFCIPHVCHLKNCGCARFINAVQFRKMQFNFCSKES
jgi:hypothetical protein